METKTILYVDDDEDDQELLTQAVHSADDQVEVIVARNGLEALNWLTNCKADHQKLPCLIVLDLNMPFLSGSEVFEKLRADNELMQVPVIIFSSSEKPADRIAFTEKGTEYFTKPADYTCMHSIAKHMVSRCSC